MRDSCHLDIVNLARTDTLYADILWKTRNGHAHVGRNPLGRAFGGPL